MNEISQEKIDKAKLRKLRICATSHDGHAAKKDGLTSSLHSLARVLIIKDPYMITPRSPFYEFGRSNVVLDSDVTSYEAEVKLILAAIIQEVPKFKGSVLEIITSKYNIYKVLSGELERLHQYIHCPNGNYSYVHGTPEEFADELYTQGILSKSIKFYHILAPMLTALSDALATRPDLKFNISIYGTSNFREYHYKQLTENYVNKLTKHGKITREHMLKVRDMYYHAGINNNYVYTAVQRSIHNYASLTSDEITNKIQVTKKKNIITKKFTSLKHGADLYKRLHGTVTYMQELFTIGEYNTIVDTVTELDNDTKLKNSGYIQGQTRDTIVGLYKASIAKLEPVPI